MSKNLALVLGILLALSTLQAVKIEQRTLSIQETESIFVPPDLCVATIVVENVHRDRMKAYEKTNEIMAEINKAVKELGIDPKDMKTMQFNVSEQYKYEENNRVLEGYRISNTLRVKIRDFSKIMPIINAAMTAGASRIENVSFTLENTDDYETQVREKTLKKAQAKAEHIARLMGVTLGKPITVNEYNTNRANEVSIVAGQRLFNPDIGATIEPGEIEMSYSVSITYELE